MKITCTNKADVNFKLFVGVAVDYTIFTAPSPSFQNFRYLSFNCKKEQKMLLPKSIFHQKFPNQSKNKPKTFLLAPPSTDEANRENHDLRTSVIFAPFKFE